MQVRRNFADLPGHGKVDMSDQTRSRLAVDLDDLERQLRQAAGSQPRAVTSDPLAELARIVDQDDPYKKMFDQRRPAAPASPQPEAAARQPASDPFAYLSRGSAALARPAPAAPVVEPQASAPTPAVSRDMLTEFDQLLRTELRGVVPAEGHVSTPGHLGGRPEDRELTLDARDLDEFDRRLREDERVREPQAAAQPYEEPAVEPEADQRGFETPQPRRGLIIASALLGVAVLGIGAVVGLPKLTGTPRTSSGEPPVIKAEAGPSKVQPQNPGGVEIPNQNKQIFERTPEPRAADTRVVNREEQPIDVQAAARAAPRVILPGPGGAPAAPAAAEAPAAPATPASPSPAVTAPPPVSAAQSPALGEPRRVRTVAVRPDGTIAPPPGSPAAAAPAASAAPATASAPAPASAAPANPAAPAQAAAGQAPRPVVGAPRPPGSRPPAQDEAPRAAAPTQTAAAGPAASAPAAVRPAPQAAAAPAAAPAAAAGSGFMIQLGAPGSESEARATFAALQRRYADQLGSEQPVIRRADVGEGKTVFRLRVGPYSREDAVQRCEALKAAGGQCFIARN